MRRSPLQAFRFALAMALASATASPGLVAGDLPEPAAPASFVGSASCRACHERFYKLWAPSYHGLAMQPYTPEFAAGELEPQAEAIEIGPNRYRAHVGPEQGWFTESGPGGERKLPIEHALGGKNVYYFLTPTERGRLQTLPLAFDVRRREWFDTAGSGVRHFPGMAEDEPVHWSEPEYTFNTSCYGCHVSQLSSNYDLASDTYDTAWAEPGINCETCHGPAGEHVRVFNEAEPGTAPADMEIIRTVEFDVEQTNSMCAPCHAKMAPLSVSFEPGQRFFDHYDLVGFEHRDYYPDGRDLGENYTYTSWSMSPCVRSGRLDCVHCHTSSGRFRFKDEPDRACLPCHEKRVENAAAHTRHKPESSGSRCVACHMPKTEFARMVRSDHSMRPPTPATTLAFESPNACNLCHDDRDAAWSDRFVREWRDRDYQAPVLHRAGLVAAAREGDWTRLDEMLTEIGGPGRDEIFAGSFIRLLGPCGDPRKWPVIVDALRDPSAFVRSTAAEALNRYFTRESVEGLIEAASDEYRVVRVRAAASMAALPREWLPEEQRKLLETATDELLQTMRARPDDHLSHYNLGNFRAERGEFDLAVAGYRTAMELRPREIPPYVNASLAYNALGQNDLAEESLRQALELDPQSIAARLNLGMLLGELGRLPEAEQAFREAFSVDPESAVAAFNLCVIVAGRDLEEALPWCRKAAELRPDDPRYLHTLAFYLHQDGDTRSATEILEHTVQEGPVSPDLYGLLGGIAEEGGDMDRAVSIYRQAAQDQRLREPDRAAFASRAAAVERR